MIDLYESETDVKISKKGSKQRGFFFLILGLIFQILFLWGYWSFLDASGSWATFWLTIINSEYFPFSTILFIFGAGCLLIAIREFRWQEAWIIKTTLFPETPGVQKRWKLFKWSGSKEIVQNQIVTLRIHTIPLDKYKLYQRYLLEIDYQETSDSNVKTLVLYKENDDSTHSTTMRLAGKIQEILAISEEIERTEASTSKMER